MNIRLDGKRALVTGGNSGIGEAIVFALADAGASVAVNYISNSESAKKIAECINESGTEAFAIRADISNPSDVESMFSRIDKIWGGLDILVNNAGISGKRAMAWEADPNEWRKIVEVNLFGTFFCSAEALKRMVVKKSGVILSINSAHEVIAFSGYSAFTASKAGIGMLTQTLAQEAAQYGVRVLALGPGAIMTRRNPAQDNQESVKDIPEKLQNNRIGTAEEIAKIAVVLVSDISSYVTGQTLFADGDMSNFTEIIHSS